MLSREVVGDVAERIVTRVIERARASGSRLDEVVLGALYAERQRLARVSSDRRSARDREYWGALRRELVRGRDDGSEGLLRSIVSRYAEEVAGEFDPRVYGFATKVLPRALGMIARAEAHGPGTLEGNIHVQGDVAALRALAARGTIILAPTHVSNVAKAFLITRGMAELMRLASTMGAEPMTLSGLAGIGDLMVTCQSPLSRNHRVGVALARGQRLDAAVAELGMVAEGVYAARAARALAAARQLELPLFASVDRVLHEGLAPAAALDELMRLPVGRDVALSGSSPRG